MSKTIKLQDEMYWDSQAVMHNKTGLDEILTGLLDKIDDKEIDSYSFGTSGYVRLTNGFQIAWTTKQVTAGGTLWSGTGIYYSDHPLGNWVVPFSTYPYTVHSHCNSLQFWANAAGSSATSAGTVRCFRPNNSTATIWVGAIAFGKWK